MMKWLKVMVAAIFVCTVLVGCSSDQPTASQKNGDESGKAGSALIESDEGQGYYKYKANTPVNFDMDMDGKDEEIQYDSAGGKLSIAGYEALEIDTTLAQKDYFIIIEFKDRNGIELNMIGIIEDGPESDLRTSVYSIIENAGKKAFVNVGAVPGEIAPVSQYDESNTDDFNYKALSIMGQGIDAPVRMTLLPNVNWFGRNLFIYDADNHCLIDNMSKSKQDYTLKMELTVEKDVVAYRDRDENSETVNIKAGQKVTLHHTDNVKWIAMVTEDGTLGWVLAQDATTDNFSGFPTVD